MIVVDTSVWIDYVNGVASPKTDLLDAELGNDRIITGDLIIAEFLQGFKKDTQYFEAKELMDSLQYYDFVGKEIALKAAENFRKLRKKGITVRKTVDVIIATFCVEYGYELLHNDKDFDAMADVLGLRVML
jgi:predicted nucleic acid-binding protein